MNLLDDEYFNKYLKDLELKEPKMTNTEKEKEKLFRPGDMFVMDANSRFIITTVDNLGIKTYALAHVVKDRVTSTPDKEVWICEKLHNLVKDGRFVYMYNIFDIVLVRI